MLRHQAIDGPFNVHSSTALTFCLPGQVRLIASGNGSHRYVDCVPMAAGKEKALQWLRAKWVHCSRLCLVTETVTTYCESLNVHVMSDVGAWFCCGVLWFVCQGVRLGR